MVVQRRGGEKRCRYFLLQAGDGKRDAQESRGLGGVYKRQLRRNENPYKRALITLKKWEKDGMSTAYSRKFSKDGKRNGFIADNINDDLIKRYNDAIITAGAKIFEKTFKSAAA